ncbi:hypothetical protein JYK00_05810 [Thermosipho ferrireducens]|uniref:Uncharacterized protein n=1 Tax=Thermosipho ferrireducens TaxID=2571116 RepID=A0ABX7S554_9BACT|nr:hypothetical protein [Thermosipho ferrireducens]QTA37259.1 hypothetical protein JYK00_05810 [Thermosipho ferrireducens]
MFGGLLIAAGILLILAVFFSLTSPFWIFIGFLITAAGLGMMIKKFPSGIGATIVGIIVILTAFEFINIGFWEFILVLIGAGLIEGGIKVLISS